MDATHHWGKRARAKMDMAARARRLALEVVNDADRRALLQFASELDAEVEVLERDTKKAITRLPGLIPDGQAYEQREQSS